MMLNEVLLAVEDAVATIHDARPVLPSFVHPHLMLFPIRFGFEGLLGFQFGTIRAEHVWLTALALRLVVSEQNRRSNTNVVGWSKAWLNFQIQWAANVGRGS